MAKWIPGTEAVTVERCQAFDVRKFGFEDGRIGQRAGEKFDFWRKDCAGLGVALDRKVYDEGYAEGLSQYCSCQNGFMAGVKDEFAEFKLQYLMCKSPQYKKFISGHEKGLTHIKNPELSKKINDVKTEYDEPKIQALAQSICPQ